jgi:triosephosphate isomerase
MRKIPKTKYLIVANWKNYPDSLKEAKKNFNIIKSKKISTKKIVTVICPSVVHLGELARSYRGKNISFGAQNFIYDQKKPHTGEISIPQLNDLGVQYVIVGHAERRAMGEDNELIANKIRGAVDNGIMPILCVGEIKRDSSGEYLKYVERELIESLAKIDKKNLDKIVIAYEPIWAIGKGKKAISPHEIHQMVIFIKKVLVSRFDKKIAMSVPVIYGGSVDPDNCEEILGDGEVRGLLIGRASVNPYSFVDILKSV